MAVHAEVFTVDGDARIAAARPGRPGPVKQVVAEELVHEGDVLFVVVERQVVQPVNCLVFDVVVQLDL